MDHVHHHVALVMAVARAVGLILTDGVQGIAGADAVVDFVDDFVAPDGAGLIEALLVVRCI